MLVSSKVTTFEETILSKMLFILDYKEEGKINILSLYKKIKGRYSNLDEFIYSLEVLFILGEINVDFGKGEVIYAKRNRE